jgi:putative membrane protein
MSRLSRPILSTLLGALAVAPISAWAQQGPTNGNYGYGRHMMWDGDWGFGMLLGPLFSVLLLVAVIAAVVLLVRWIGGPVHGHLHHSMSQHRMPLDILKERFARGEIDKDEYEERRRVLGA